MNYTKEISLYILFFLSRGKGELDVGNVEKLMSEHGLQILYTSLFHYNSELQFSQKIFWTPNNRSLRLKHLIISRNTLCLTGLLSIVFHTLMLSTPTHNQIDKLCASTDLSKHNTKMSRIFLAGGTGWRRAVFVLFVSLFGLL